MRLFVNAAFVAALALPAIRPAADVAAPPSHCRGSLDGADLTTAVEFDDGYTVEAPWKVVRIRQSPSGAQPTRSVAVHLDRIVEKEPTGKLVTTPFPAPIEATFQGRDDDEIVHHAAQVWCMTVIKVKSDGGSIVPGQGKSPLVRSAARLVRGSPTA